MSTLKKFVTTTFLGRWLLLPYRLGLALRSLKIGYAFRWALYSREHYNFSYDLEPRNRDDLVAFLAVVCQTPYETIHQYMQEVENDQALFSYLKSHIQNSSERYVMDPIPRLGKRLGWYALVRALKPRLVVETGVDRGLGSCVLAAALLKNQTEGFPGKLMPIDINPKAGILFQSPYTQTGQLVVSDSLVALDNLQEPVDLFLHDSDHADEHERAEYKAVAKNLSPHALVVTDNGYFTNALLDFARSTNRHYLYFQDRPYHHWWIGDGLGIAWSKDFKPN